MAKNSKFAGDDIESVILNGECLDGDRIERLAILDGFDPALLGTSGFPKPRGVSRRINKGWWPGITARTLMGLWFEGTCGPGRFGGVLIRWGWHDEAIAAPPRMGLGT